MRDIFIHMDLKLENRYLNRSTCQFLSQYMVILEFFNRKIGVRTNLNLKINLSISLKSSYFTFRRVFFHIATKRKSGEQGMHTFKVNYTFIETFRFNKLVNFKSCELFCHHKLLEFPKIALQKKKTILLKSSPRTLTR